MKLAIMQPYFMPYIGYFQAIAAVDKYILYENLTFIKDAWMNRNKLIQKNGIPFTITVPLLHKSSNTLISEVEVDNSQPWANKLLKSLWLNYKGSEYFEEVYSLMENIFADKYDTLHNLNSTSIKRISNYIGLTTEIISDNHNYIQYEKKLDKFDDYSIFPELEKTKPIKKVARVIKMCKQENCDLFVNAIGGQVLYSKQEFSQYGIDIRFIKTDEKIQYKQFKNEFVPNLSIIDVLMHNGKEGTKQLLNAYKLI